MAQTGIKPPIAPRSLVSDGVSAARLLNVKTGGRLALVNSKWGESQTVSLIAPLKQWMNTKVESEATFRSLGTNAAAAYCRLKPSFLTSTASDASACLK